jgi:transposase
MMTMTKRQVTHRSDDVKQSLMAKMLPPNNVSVAQLAKETGIPKGTLYTWRAQHSDHKTKPKNTRSKTLSGADKLAIITETDSLNEVTLSEYCRRKGLYPEQIQDWKAAFIQAYLGNPSKAAQNRLREQGKHIKDLQTEVRRKDKALAEAAVLLMLQKKVQAIWAEPEDEKSTCPSANK